MKCNYKGKLNRDIFTPEVMQEILNIVRPKILAELEEPTREAMFTVQKQWELCVILALRQMGFGRNRLEKFFEYLQQEYEEFDAEAKSTDLEWFPNKKGQTYTPEKYTNAASAVARRLRDLNEANIDFQYLLDIEDMKVGETDVIKLAKNISRRLPKKHKKESIT